MDALKNFAYSTVLTAPSTPTAGTTLVVQSGDGAKFPTAPFDLTLYPVGSLPLIGNAEIVRCTNVATDTLTIVRAQYGTSAQTVAVGWAVDNAVTAALLAQLLAIANFNAAGKNFILNGGMDIAQRGTSFSSSGATTYGLDRWCFQSSASNMTFAQGSASPPVGLQFFQSVTATSASSSTWYLSQSMETHNVIPLQGETVTVSFQYKLPVNFTNAVVLKVAYSTGTDANLLNSGTSITLAAGTNVNTSTGAITNNSAWTTGTATFVVPSTATSFVLQFSSATNVVSTGQFDVTGVQLEIGSVNTPFSRHCGAIGEELAMCQRYYCQMAATNLNDPVGSGVAVATTASNLQWQGAFPVTMRAVPVLTQSATNTLKWYSNVGPNSISAMVLNQTTTATFGISCTVSGATAGGAYVILGAAAAFVGFSAEL